MLVFIQKTFCDLFLLFLLLLFVSCIVVRNGKREERWEGRPRGRCMVYKVENVHIQLRIIIKFPENPSITLFFIYMGV